MKKKVVGGGGRTRRVEPEPTSRTTPWIIPAAAIATALVAILSARGLTEDSTLPTRAEVPSTVAPHKGTDPDLPSVVQIRVEETAVPFAYPGGLQRGEGAEGGQQEARKKADTSLLSWLLYPISVVEWEAAHWDGVPLLLRRHPLFYTALNSGLAEVDALLMVQARESTKPLLMHPTMPHTQADCSIVKGGMDDLTAECVDSCAVLYPTNPISSVIRHVLLSIFAIPFLWNFMWSSPSFIVECTACASDTVSTRSIRSPSHEHTDGLLEDRCVCIAIVACLAAQFVSNVT